MMYRHILCVVVGGGAIAGSGCGAEPPSSSPTTPTPAAKLSSFDVVSAVAADSVSVTASGRVSDPSARAVVSAPLAARLKRLAVLPGDVVTRGAVVAELAIPELADSAATLRGARAQRAVVEARLGHLRALRAEGLPRVADELAAQGDAAALDADIGRALALLRAVDVDVSDAALDEVVARGAFVARAPVAGVVTDVGEFAVGAVMPAGAVIASLYATPGNRKNARIIMRLPVDTPDPQAATLVPGGIALKPLLAKGPATWRDGASDRVFVVVDPPKAAAPADGDAALAAVGAVLVDGRSVTVELTLAHPGAVRLPVSAVRLGGDGVAEVAVVGARAPLATQVTVLGRAHGDVIIDGVDPGTVVARDARAALAENAGGA